MTTAAVSLLSLFPPYFLRAFDNSIYDTFIRATISDKDQTLPVIVDIDDDSLARYGQWPWPRYRVAALLERLRQAGAAAIAVDFLFSEPDRTSLPILVDQLQKEVGLNLDLPALDSEILDNDKRLADVLGQGPFVLGSKMVFGRSEIPCPHRSPQLVWQLNKDMTDGQDDMFQAQGAITSLDMFMDAAEYCGFLNVAPDEDGIVRRIPLVITCNGVVQPNLVLALLMRALDTNTLSIRATPQGLEWIQVDDLRIPVDANGNFPIVYKPWETIPRISAARVLNQDVEQDELAGRIVIVGSTNQELKDIITTPVHASYPAVAIYATTLDNILRGEFILRPFWARGLEFMLVCASGLLLSVLLTWFRPIWSVLAAMGAGSGVWGVCFWAFAQDRIFITPLWPSITLVAVFLPCIWLKYALAERKAYNNSQKLVRAQSATIEVLASVIETRDIETGEHIQRVQELVKLLAQELRSHPRFQKALAGDAFQLLVMAAPLHDMGKVGVPDSILKKPGPLTPEEFEVMKLHTEYGLNILEKTEEKLGSNHFIEMAKIVTYTHHERWDGSGYPLGLAREEIPVAGRLMAIVDVFDAVSSARVYKPAMPFHEAMSIIAKGSETHFDPDAVEVFLGLAEEIHAVISAKPGSEPAKPDPAN